MTATANGAASPGNATDGGVVGAGVPGIPSCSSSSSMSTQAPPATAATSGTNQGHCKGHRRQESMYAMTGLYSESVPEQDDVPDTKCTTTFCHDTVIKCHSRNPSAGFDREKAAHNTTYTNEQPAVIIRDTKECGILSCRPSFIQKYAGIKVSCRRATCRPPRNIT